MDDLFSSELKELVSKSRETAIELGYDYISTIHFFIADCESNKPGSIMRFGFSNDKEFEIFKSNYTLEVKSLLDLSDASLPLTIEAEKTIRLTESVRVRCKQKEAYPCHFFIAALKNRKSLIFECFKHDNKALDNLTKYYEDLGDFQKNKITTEKISKQYFASNANRKNGLINRIIKIFTG